jgi:hypothetical protein
VLSWTWISRPIIGCISVGRKGNVSAAHRSRFSGLLNLDGSRGTLTIGWSRFGMVRELLFGRSSSQAF